MNPSPLKQSHPISSDTMYIIKYSRTSLERHLFWNIIIFLTKLFSSYKLLKTLWNDPVLGGTLPFTLFFDIKCSLLLKTSTTVQWTSLEENSVWKENLLHNNLDLWFKSSLFGHFCLVEKNVCLIRIKYCGLKAILFTWCPLYTKILKAPSLYPPPNQTHS